MLNNKYVLATLTLSILASCAGPESYQAKMDRYTPKHFGANQVPEITMEGFSFSTNKPGRTPASATRPSVEAIGTDEVAISNKKLYFLTLFGQYEIMQKYSAEFDAPAVNICPQFHNSLLEHNGRKAGFAANITTKNNKKFIYDVSKLGDASYVAMHPELSLPISKSEVNPKVVDIMRNEGEKITESRMNELVHSAIDLHLSKTYNEIRELCEFGVSDNYYIYENMITHIKNTNFPPAPSNMNTLLKTTVFSNIALVTALEKVQATPMRSIASVDVKKKDTSVPYSNEVMARLNVEWAREYYDYLKTDKQ